MVIREGGEQCWQSSASRIPSKNPRGIQARFDYCVSDLSAADVIEMIKCLTPKEQAEVKGFALTLPDNTEAAGATPQIMSREMFERAKEHVFAHYGPLLEKLAK